jgi:hypothetical protein
VREENQEGESEEGRAIKQDNEMEKDDLNRRRRN